MKVQSVRSGGFSTVTTTELDVMRTSALSISRTVATGFVLAALLLASPAAAQGLTWDSGDDDDDYECSMTDHAIRSALARQGYTEVKLNVPSDSRVQARGTKDGVSYVLQVSTCNGRVYSRQPRGAA